MVRDLLKSAAYVTFDDDTIRRASDEGPYNQLKALSDQAKDSGLPVVIDEVQRLRELAFALKRIVDQDNRRGHFVLTGSADIFTSGKAYDSLAGGVTPLTLRPLSTAEIYHAFPCRILDAIADAPENPLPLLPKPLIDPKSSILWFAAASRKCASYLTATGWTDGQVMSTALLSAMFQRFIPCARRMPCDG